MNEKSPLLVIAIIEEFEVAPKEPVKSNEKNNKSKLTYKYYLGQQGC